MNFTSWQKPVLVPTQVPSELSVKLCWGPPGPLMHLGLNLSALFSSWGSPLSCFLLSVEEAHSEQLQKRGSRKYLTTPSPWCHRYSISACFIINKPTGEAGKHRTNNLARNLTSKREIICIKRSESWREHQGRQSAGANSSRNGNTYLGIPLLRTTKQSC